MKTLFVLMSLAGAIVHAQEICTNAEGSIQYQSATNLGDFTYIKAPSIKLAGNEVAYLDISSDDGICVALGHLKSVGGGNTWIYGNFPPYPMLAHLDGKGKVSSIAQALGEAGHSVIDFVNCSNK